jgi:hypothetical protein
MCDCQVCQFSRDVKARMDTMPEDAKVLVRELMDNLVEVENDRDYYKAIVTGVWPSADEVIKQSREILANKMAAKEIG